MTRQLKIRTFVSSSDASTRTERGFTLVELLISMALLVTILAIVIQITTQTTQVWKSSTSRIQAFQESRAAFESMTRKLSQATVSTYYDYYDSSNRPRSSYSGADLANFEPKTYDRISDLHFVSGHAETLLQDSPESIVTQTHAVFFQTPMGYSVDYRRLDSALNAAGFFLQFGDDSGTVPEHVRDTPGYVARHRFRLMEMTQPTEELALFGLAPGEQNKWFTQAAPDSSRILAENVIALVLLPKLPHHEDLSGAAVAPNYNYNSRVPVGSATDPAWPGANPPFPPDRFTANGRDGTIEASRHHQLPPLMRVVMIVIDESSASRLQGDDTGVPPGVDLRGTNLFTDASKLEEDIRAVEDICIAKSGNATGNTMPLTYRVFNTDIIMREAKWSND